MMSPYKIKKDCFSSHRITADYLTSLAKEKKINVLDLGCDVGFIGKLSDNQNIKFTGADISSESLKNLPEIYQSKIELDLNGQNWKINKKYDVVVFTDVVEHLINPAAGLKQITGLLKTDGVLVLSVPNFVFIFVRLIILLGFYPQDPRGLFDKTHLHHYTRSSIKSLITNSGFKIINEKYTNPPIYFVAPRLLNNPIGNIFYYFLHFLARLMPELFAYQFIFFCQKDW